MNGLKHRAKALALVPVLGMVAKSAEGLEMIRGQRNRLAEGIRSCDARGETVPTWARKLLQRMDSLLGDAEVRA